MMLENNAATRSETCQLRFEHLKSNISLKEKVIPGFHLSFRTSVSVHAVWTPKQRRNMLPSRHAFSLSTGPGQVQEKVHSNQGRKG